MKTKLPITVLVQTKNEEIGIAECLANLGAFDEVIVVDSNSEDRTVEIVESLGYPAVCFTWDGKYPKKKQWQLENLRTKHSWILFMDADEYPNEDLINELRALTDSATLHDYAACEIALDYVFAGQLLQFGHRVVKRALVRKGLNHFPEINDLEAPGMGELEGHYQPISDGIVRKLSGRIIHHDRDPVRTWFDRHNKYSDWEAYLRTHPTTRKTTADRRSTQGKIFDRLPAKPLIFFIYSYLLKQGFRDGRAGFDYAFALSSYYWQISLKVRENKRG